MWQTTKFAFPENSFDGVVLNFVLCFVLLFKIIILSLEHMTIEEGENSDKNKNLHGLNVLLLSAKTMKSDLLIFRITFFSFLIFHFFTIKVIFNDVLKFTLLHLTANANNLISHFANGAYALYSLIFQIFHCIVGMAFINPEQWIASSFVYALALAHFMHIAQAQAHWICRENFHYAPMKWLISTIFNIYFC